MNASTIDRWGVRITMWTGMILATWFRWDWGDVFVVIAISIPLLLIVDWAFGRLKWRFTIEREVDE